MSAANDVQKPFAVVCIRADGREKLFAHYATQHEAAMVAARLCEVGCAAKVEPQRPLACASVAIDGPAA